MLARSLLQLTLLPANRKVFGRQPLAECIRESMRNFNCPGAFSAKCVPLQNSQEAKACADVLLSKAARVRTVCKRFAGCQHERWPKAVYGDKMVGYFQIL